MWKAMFLEEPHDQTEILLVSAKTDERIGVVVNDGEHKLVLLKRTDLSFDEIMYWMEIPKIPNFRHRT